MAKLFLIPIIFLSWVNFVLAGDISQINFANDLQAVKPNEIASLKIQLQYSGDSHPTSCMQMFTNSGTGQFFSDQQATNPVDKLTINSNWTNKNFYYKDSTPGTYIITVKVIPVSCSSLTDQAAQWTATQNIVVSDSSAQNQTQTQQNQTTQSNSTTTSPTPGFSTGSSFPVEPQIFANAGSDKTGVVGADVYFSGQALGLKKESLDGARYVWNFGDGSSREGQNVLHIYLYPGDYAVILNVSSGQYSASDELLVKIVASQIKISEADSDFIKISNNSNVTIDLSGWFLRAGNKIFIFPKNTIIKANSNLNIPSINSGLNPVSTAELLYPNGSLAFSWQKPVVEEIKEINEIKEIKTETEIKPEAENIQEQTAGVDVVNIEVKDKNFWDSKIFMFIVIGVGLVSVTGLLFIRRKHEQ